MDDTPTPPDDLAHIKRPGTRVTYRASQRRADRTVWLGLVLHLPSLLVSMVLVGAAAAVVEPWLGVPAWPAAVLWAASGVLAFHRPSERLLARHVLRLHHPLPEEFRILAPVWYEVTARAGVDGRRYELWVEESDDLNAFAAAGHIVAVTRRALHELPASRLAAVLAHELGHHTNGHAWAGMLAWWYAAPWRLLRRSLDRAAPPLLRSARGCSVATLATVAVITGYLALVTLQATYGLPLLLVAAPYLTAAVRRRAELRADAHAARLGFGHPLALTLYEHMNAEAAGPHPAAPSGLAARLLSDHPDYRTRLHHLQAHL
ncbi:MULTISPECIES: M48 family metalloprotease [Streptomyces]|uniref:M48 family metalloprotease n=1 Tax=Streptomyces TaxID=1883 RepID=UPI00167A75F5|nr:MULTISPECIES: M48 family metalloprotease [Streptomyces]MBD3577194.1 M48 family metalloprotease [Streptomyces sp. KD18]GGS86670.1 peptidase M48 [Streptomyces toxytricini]